MRMNNYTARIRVLEPDLSLERLKESLEARLLRLHPKIVFKLGGISPAEGGIVLAEIATDSRKTQLLQTLKSLEDAIPVCVEAVGWGWLLPRPVDSAADETGFGRPDPFEKAEPQAEIRHRYLFEHKSLLSGLVRFGLFLAVIGLYLAAIVLYLTHLRPTTIPGPASTSHLTLMSAVRLIIYPLSFLAWCMIVNPPPAPGKYIAEIVCDAEGIEFHYWLRTRPKRLAWERIWGLGLYQPRWVLRYDSKSLAFLASQSAGLDNPDMLIKTILQRATLNYTHTNVGVAVYKRFDAPD